jgi:hypothetical protein
MLYWGGQDGLDRESDDRILSVCPWSCLKQIEGCHNASSKFDVLEAESPSIFDAGCWSFYVMHRNLIL